MKERIGKKIDEEVKRIRNTRDPQGRLEGLLFVVAKTACEIDALYEIVEKELSFIKEELRRLNGKSRI